MFLDESFVVRVTTNHSERERFERRNYVNSLSPYDAFERLFETTFMLFRLSTSNPDNALVNMCKDIRDDRKRQKDHEKPRFSFPSLPGHLVGGRILGELVLCTANGLVLGKYIGCERLTR